MLGRFSRHSIEKLQYPLRLAGQNKTRRAKTTAGYLFCRYLAAAIIDTAIGHGGITQHNATNTGTFH